MKLIKNSIHARSYYYKETRFDNYEVANLTISNLEIVRLRLKARLIQARIYEI